jgi:hypothetical protein
MESPHQLALVERDYESEEDRAHYLELRPTDRVGGLVGWWQTKKVRMLHRLTGHPLYALEVKSVKRDGDILEVRCRECRLVWDESRDDAGEMPLAFDFKRLRHLLFTIYNREYLMSHTPNCATKTAVLAKRGEIDRVYECGCELKQTKGALQEAMREIDKLL